MGEASAPSLIRQLCKGRLIWLPQLGVGYYPVTCGIEPYDQEYFDQFARAANTDLGRALMAARCDLVARHWHGPMIDVGIGSGAFILARLIRRKRTLGYDVNPAALAWLDERGLLVDPYLVPCQAASLWDVLEHIADFPKLLEQITEWLFVSLPIFRDVEHVLASKHFKPAEHYWYFTRDGLVALLYSFGFELVEETDVETRLGREDIGSFAFRRIAK